MTRHPPVRIGCGAGFAGDRTEPAVDLVVRGGLDFIVLECLAERTVALSQLERMRDPEAGYDPRLDRRLRPLLEPLARTGTRLVSNIGAANPLAGARRIEQLAQAQGVRTTVAALTGDDVLDLIDPSSPAWEDGVPLEAHGELVSANAYLGAEALLPALETGADIVICGRVADPSLFVAPLVHTHGWDMRDWRRLADATVAGHLLECGPQVTGGYFADPPHKIVPDLAHLGYPLAEVDEDATAVVTKLAGTGGRVDRMTVTEQLAYEVIDPTSYQTPDVRADFTSVRIDTVAADRVRVHGATGRPRPAELKVSVGYRAGFRCEAEISYAGSTALARAELAGDVIRTRLAGHLARLRIDIIGLDSLHGPQLAAGYQAYECRLRVSGLAESLERVEAVGEEVTALYTAGPAGGGGVRVHTEEVIAVVSTSVPRTAVTPRVQRLEATCR